VISRKSLFIKQTKPIIMTVVTSVMINYLPLIFLFIHQNYIFSQIYFFTSYLNFIIMIIKKGKKIRIHGVKIRILQEEFCK
jgi:hypothetical protein